MSAAVFRAVRRAWALRPVKVAACGLASTGVDVVTMIALVELGRVPVAVAAFLAAATGAVVNFTGNKLWCFQDRSPMAFRQFAAYVLVCVATWSFVALAVHVLFTVGTPYVLAKAVAQILVFISWSYPAQARFVFPSVPSVGLGVARAIGPSAPRRSAPSGALRAGFGAARPDTKESPCVSTSP